MTEFRTRTNLLDLIDADITTEQFDVFVSQILDKEVSVYLAIMRLN